MGARPQRDWMGAFDDQSVTAVLLVHYRSATNGDAEDLDFAFEGITTGVLSVTVTKHIEDDAGAASEGQAKRVKIGTLPLTGKDPERFGRLLTYYKKRGAAPGAAGKADHVTFKKVDQGKTTVLAEIEDSSREFNGRSDLLTFDEILSRIRQANPDRPPTDEPVPAPHPK